MIKNIPSDFYSTKSGIYHEGTGLSKIIKSSGPDPY